MLTILIDDERDFRDGRSAVVLRSSAAALAMIRSLAGARIDELWLDHDLGGDDTIRPVTSYLEEIAYLEYPVNIGVIYVHTANASAAQAIVKGLIHYGYKVIRVNTDQLITQPPPPFTPD